MQPVEIAEFYRNYGEASFRADEPVYADICAGLADHPQLLELISRHLPQAAQPNLLFAAVHHLLLGARVHPLASLYEGEVADDDPAATFADFVLTNASDIEHLLATRSTQTNESGRSALLAWILQDAHRRTGEELAWVDLGASGGLNLNVDHFRIDYAVAGETVTVGDHDAQLQLSCEVRGGEFTATPTHAPLAWRCGVDRSPINVVDDDELRWLHACLWPSRRDRHDRLRSAAAIARSQPPHMITADAAPGLAEAFAQAPVETTLVVTTTWVWYYLPTETRQAVLDVMAASDRRVLWYSVEGAGVVASLGEPLQTESITSTIGLVTLGAGEPQHDEVLGHCHAHGAWMSIK